jgi:peptidoglycan/LPS O-acetylase OafA/YrhL
MSGAEHQREFMGPAAGQRSAHGRVYQIDLLRFFAAICVMMFHYTFRGYAADDFLDIRFDAIGTLSRYGYLGVDLFFIISGFVISMSVVGQSATRFWISRVTRLCPAFWVCCSLTFLVMLLADDPRFHATWPQYVLNLTIVDIMGQGSLIDGVYWSLGVEIIFYFWILILAVFKQIRFLERYLWIWIGSAIVLHFAHGALPIRIISHALITPSSPYFVAGVAFYLIYRGGSSLSRIMLLIASYGFAQFLQAREVAGLRSLYHQDFSYLATTFLVTSFFGVFALLSTRRLEWLNRRAFLSVGALTYPLYLLHQNIGYIAMNSLAGHLCDYCALALVIGAAIFGAYLVHVGVERPTASLLRRTLTSISDRTPRLLLALGHPATARWGPRGQLESDPSPPQWESGGFCEVARRDRGAARQRDLIE